MDTVTTKDGACVISLLFPISHLAHKFVFRDVPEYVRRHLLFVDKIHHSLLAKLVCWQMQPCLHNLDPVRVDSN